MYYTPVSFKYWRIDSVKKVEFCRNMQKKTTDRIFVFVRCAYVGLINKKPDNNARNE